MPRRSNKFVAGTNTTSITLASESAVDNITSNPLTSQCEWERRKGSYFPFSSRVSETEDEDGLDDDREILEFEVTGIVKRAFLKADAKSHMVGVDIGVNEIERIKAFVRTIPGFIEVDYRWPFEGSEAKFISKEDLEEEFREAWDGRNIDVHDIDSRVPLSINDIEEGAKVFVEYTIVSYFGRKAKNGEEGFNPGCTMKLLSIDLLRQQE